MLAHFFLFMCMRPLKLTNAPIASRPDENNKKDADDQHNIQQPQQDPPMETLNKEMFSNNEDIHKVKGDEIDNPFP